MITKVPRVQTFDDGRTTVVELPPGFIGNNTAVPTCTFAELVGENAVGEPGNPECLPASQVGTISFDVHQPSFEEVTVPLYNMEVTSFGVAVQLGFNDKGTVIQVLDASVRPGDSGITVTSPNIERTAEFRDVTVTTWGLPASSVNDPLRGKECYSALHPACYGGNEGANYPVKPFLSNPTSCEPHIAHMEADSWEEPNTWSHAETEVTPASSECERVPFDPEIKVAPTTRSAESSSGLDISLIVPQTWENPSGIETANLKNTVLALPVGYTANPSLASGLGTCTPEQFASETSSSLPGAGCPSESKIGVVNVETPVLDEKLTGNIYIATPYDNKFDSLLGLYIVVKLPARGIVVKLQGQIEPNETTGQLVTTFDENPQVPFSKFTLELDQDQTSPLVSPPACGTYTAEADFTPWSAPLAPQLQESSFQIENGIGGGPCPSGGTPPFNPALSAGTENNEAGAYSPMNIYITRNDGEQEITGFSSQLPPGLTANLTGVPFCSEADIAHARELSGAQEETDPACPVASEIGETSRQRRSRIGTRRHAGESVYGRPVRRRAILDRRDHQRKGRPVRPRHRRRTPPPVHQPRNGRRQHPRRRRQSDPTHHQRDRRPRPRHPRQHRPQRLLAEPNQLQSTNILSDGHRRRRGPHQPQGQRPRHDQQPVPRDCLSRRCSSNRDSGLDLGQNEQSRRREPHREADLPQ